MSTELDDVLGPLVEVVRAERRAAMIAGLRELASFLESTPTAPASWDHNYLVSTQTAEEFREIARHVGFAKKEFDGEWVSLKKNFGPVQYEVFVHRSKVCEKRVVGTRVVPEHVEEVVEWECTDSILRGE